MKLIMRLVHFAIHGHVCHVAGEPEISRPGAAPLAPPFIRGKEIKNLRDKRPPDPEPEAVVPDVGGAPAAGGGAKAP